MYHLNINVGKLTVLQVQQTGLAHVLHLTAGLTDFCLLKAHPHTRTPAENSEGTRTDLTDTNIHQLFLLTQPVFFKILSNVKPRSHLTFFTILFLSLQREISRHKIKS